MQLFELITDLWSLLHLNTHKTIDIPYGVSDIDENFKKSDFSSESLKILMITDFSQYLDNYTPIFGVNECFKEGMDIHLDIYGEGKDLKKIQKCINNQHCPNIQYIGGFQDFTPIYKDYDLFITASYSSDIQFNIIEALRAGLPILHMDINGSGKSEYIKGNGYLMPENAIMHMRKTLKGFYENKSQLIEMGKNSRKLYEEKFMSKTEVYQ